MNISKTLCISTLILAGGFGFEALAQVPSVDIQSALLTFIIYFLFELSVLTARQSVVPCKILFGVVFSILRSLDTPSLALVLL